jgi:hypothetical protein
VLDTGSGKPFRPIAIPPQPKAEAKTDKALIASVYLTMLRALPLLPAHGDSLLGRGLSLDAIEAGNFKSTPTSDEAASITQGLAAEVDLSNVPGFYRENGEWKLTHTPSGFFVPVLDRRGHIQALQIRKDVLRHDDDPRYCWFSSKGKPQGASSGAPFHVQNPERITATGRLTITEGALKSFVAAQYMNVNEGGLLALSGVSVFQDNIAAQLKNAWPNLEQIAIAFDRDWREKREVKQQLFRLMEALQGNFESITVRTWDGPEKGLDDYLVAEAVERSEKREVA